jgi:hypothetical protein
VAWRALLAGTLECKRGAMQLPRAARNDAQ